jgi:3-oxoacyl-(acyl-carrier-protein) synthase
MNNVEILDYRFITEWKFDEFFGDKTFIENIQPDFPLVVATLSNRVRNTFGEGYDEFNEGKAKGRPSLILRTLPGAFATGVARLLEVSGQCFQISASCSASIYAFNLAGLISQAENKPVIVVGAEDFNSEYDLWRFRSLGALDMDTGRPFDSSSVGFKMGTGMTMFLVKHSSVKYHLPSIATFTKFSFHSNNPLSVNPGSSDDLINAMGDIDYQSIDFWNAHATGTPVGDRVEYDYFASTIKRDIPIVGYKGYVGHCIGASGAVEIAMSLQDREAGVLRPNIISGNKIVEDSRIITEPTSFTFKRMLKTNFGFGGRNAIAILDFE